MLGELFVEIGNFKFYPHPPKTHAFAVNVTKTMLTQLSITNNPGRPSDLSTFEASTHTQMWKGKKLPLAHTHPSLTYIAKFTNTNRA